MKVIGITGGIGAGKSLVSDLLKKLGACVVCADSLTHKIYEPNKSGSIAIKKEFGDDYLLADGSVDRKKLGSLVFSDKKQPDRLNTLVRPLLFEQISRGYPAERDLVFIDAAILIESGLYKNVDAVWLVTAPEHIKINRIILRDNIDKAQIKKRMDLQMSDDEKEKYADEIIDNGKSKVKTYIRVFKLYLREKLRK